MNSPDPIALSRARRQYQRGETYLASGHLDAAISAFEATLGEFAGHAPAALQLAMLELQRGNFGRSHQLALSAARMDIGSPAVALLLIRQLVAVGQSAMVLDICSQLPPPMWDSAQSLATVAQQLSRVGAHRMARGYARAAVERDPRHPPSLHMLAGLEVFFGETEAAVDLLERALALHPDLVDAYWLLSRLRQPDAPARIARIEQALTRVAPGEDESFLAYALHNELHDSRDYPRAWAALERACRAKRQQLNYDPAAMRSLFARLKMWSPAEVAAVRGTDKRDLTPIFVVGMHRSGTTLIERIIGGHSQVAAAGETYEFPTQLRLASGRYTSAVVDEAMVRDRVSYDYQAMGEGFLAGMRWRSRNKAFVTDKLPSNFLNIGFIAQALPHARFIHVCRDPIDTGLSNLRTLFTAACPYSYDQLEFVDYYREYQALMQHWQQLFPGRILDVRYEDVVADALGAAQRMAEFCGLPFEPGMVEIERSDDPVATASSVLVRDGIRKDRSRLWQAYVEQMRPMREALGQEG
ncbi:MAG: sulfotransferase [Lysobacterales bacterium]